MIIAKLMGGLGNQMFQYGLGRHLSSINNTELLLDIDEFQTYKLQKYSLSAFNIKAPIADEHDLLKVETKTLNIKKLLYKIARKKMTPRFKEPHFQFYPDYRGVGHFYLHNQVSNGHLYFEKME